MLKKKEKKIISSYLTPGHPTAFSGVNNVAAFHKISVKKARALLDTLDTYQTHREYHRPKNYNPYYVRNRRSLAQADLIDVRCWKQNNKGINYLLLIIDVFSRFIWLYPLKNKTGMIVAEKMKEWIRDCRTPPKKLQTDSGLEFFNKYVKKVLQEGGVELELALGTAKAAIAERANKTIQMMMTKLMRNKLKEHKGKNRYIEHLPALVRSYNTRGHRTLRGMTPEEADKKKNEARVRAIHVERFQAVPRKTPIFQLNDVVRIKLESKILTPASRSYNPQFSESLYYIVRINTRVRIPMYHLRAAEDDEEIRGGFYSEELTKVGSDEYGIEKILDTRKRGRTEEVLVRWRGFAPRWDSWIPKKSLHDL